MVRPKWSSVGKGLSRVAPAGVVRGSRVVSFDFTPDQTAFQKMLVDFSRKGLLPGYRDRPASTEFPFEILRQLGELGVLGIGLPEKYLAHGDVNVASAPVQIGLIGSQY